MHKEVQALRNNADAADVEHKKGTLPTFVSFPCSLLCLLTYWAAPIERALADQSLSFFCCFVPSNDFPFYELGASLWFASDSVQEGAVREHGTPGRAAEGAQPALPRATPPPPLDERQGEREEKTSGSEAESDPRPRRSLAEVDDLSDLEEGHRRSEAMERHSRRGVASRRTPRGSRSLSPAGRTATRTGDSHRHRSASRRRRSRN